MIFVKINPDNTIVNVHYQPFNEKHGLGMTEEELRIEGILVDSIPEPEEQEGKRPILKYNGTELYYDYEDVNEDEMTALKQQVADQEQALAELTMYIATLTTPSV
ncbi:hypothetical protein MHH85_10910 [Viridibacillus sp. FSL E2-0187]|uniref:hypothetical protein n=1 Tax=Viridibacillus sp. FSL E2-0187 TaxID=2921362 RepID=UPI0030F8261F